MISLFISGQRKYEEKFVGTQASNKPVLKRSNSEGQDKPAKTKAGPNGMTIKSMTFYKANTMEDNEKEEHSECPTAQFIVIMNKMQLLYLQLLCMSTEEKTEKDQQYVLMFRVKL